jgi:excisionase family DNA binding protein
MSDITFQFPVDEIVERLRKVVREEMAANSNAAANEAKKEPAINTKQLCDFLSITEPTVIKLRQKGKIPFFEIGSAIRYDKNEVMEALRNKQRK